MLTKVFQALKALLSHRPEQKQDVMTGMSAWFRLISRFSSVSHKSRALEGSCFSASATSGVVWPRRVADIKVGGWGLVEAIVLTLCLNWCLS